MAITNKEIIEGQLRRINEKAHTQLVLKRANRHWYLCRECNGYELPPSPLNESFTRRTSAEMIAITAAFAAVIKKRNGIG